MADVFDLFVGGRVEGFIPVAGAAPTVSTDASNGFDTAYSDGALSLAASASALAPFYDPAGAPRTAIAGDWVMARGLMGATNVASATGLAMYLQAPNGRAVVAIQRATQNSVNMYRNSAAGTGAPTWVLLGTQPSLGVTTLSFLDLSVTLGADGVVAVEFFVDNVSGGRATFTDAAVVAAGISGVVFAGVGGTGSRWSEVYARLNATTVGARVKTCRATGAGLNAQWTGAYTDINGAALSDTSVNQAATVGRKQSYPMGPVTVPVGFSISSAWNWVRAKNDGSAPTQAKSIAIVGGTEYDAAENMTPAIGLGYAGSFKRYDTNPATGQAWSADAWNTPAVQFGFASAA